MLAITVIALFALVSTAASSRPISHPVGRSQYYQQQLIDKYVRHGYTFVSIQRLSRKRYVLHFESDKDNDTDITGDGPLSLKSFMECSSDNYATCVEQLLKDRADGEALISVLLLTIFTILMIIFLSAGK